MYVCGITRQKYYCMGKYCTHSLDCILATWYRLLQITQQEEGIYFNIIVLNMSYSTFIVHW